MDPGSLVPMLFPGIPRELKVSSYENVCCNKTFKSQDRSTWVKYSQDACLPASEVVYTGNEAADNASNIAKLNEICAGVKDAAGHPKTDSRGIAFSNVGDGECQEGSYDLVPEWLTCESNGVVSCFCDYYIGTVATRYNFPREGVGTCTFCDKNDLNAADCAHGEDDEILSNPGMCDRQGYYVRIGSTNAKMELIGLDASGNLVKSPALSLDGNPDSRIDAGTWKSIYSIRIKSSGIDRANVSNDSVRFYSVPTEPGVPEEVLTTLADITTDDYSHSYLVGKVDVEGGKQLKAKSNESTSAAQITIMGADKDGVPVTEKISPGSSTSASFKEIYRIFIEGGYNEIISLVVPPAGGTGIEYGYIRVEPSKFNPSPHTNRTGVYLYSNIDPAKVRIMDEAVLGPHNAIFAFKDRFNNTFKWSQPFDFVLPTKVVLDPRTERDSADANKTMVCLKAMLYSQYIDEPDSVPTHPLGNKTLRFYEGGAVSDASDFSKLTNTSVFVREPNNGDSCTCPDLGCTTECTTSAECSPQQLGDGTFNAQPRCVYVRKCETNDDCAGIGTETCARSVDVYGTSCSADADCGCTAAAPCTAKCFKPVATATVGVCAQKCAADGDCAGAGAACDSGVCGKAALVCQESGRCMNNFGWVGDNLTCNETEVASNSRGCTRVGEASFCYSVCGWGKHTAVAAFNPNKTDEYEKRFGKSLDVQPYQAGGFPLDLGTLTIILPVAILLLAIAGKLVLDWNAAKGNAAKPKARAK
ncbi:Uncharacterised protein [uncultured archaeon]|nr:Uncharacterised protein [uncultured archaeon]